MAPCQLTPHIATPEQVAGMESVAEVPALQEVNLWKAEGGRGTSRPPILSIIIDKSTLQKSLS